MNSIVAASTVGAFTLGIAAELTLDDGHDALVLVTVTITAVGVMVAIHGRDLTDAAAREAAAS